MASFRLKSLEARSFLLFPGIAGAADATPNKVYFDATLTIFTGPSGGGKTSVLRAIHAVLLHHYCDANDPRLPDPEDLVNVQGEGNNFTVPRSEATLIFEDHSGHEHVLSIVKKGGEDRFERGSTAPWVMEAVKKGLVKMVPQDHGFRMFLARDKEPLKDMDLPWVMSYKTLLDVHADLSVDYSTVAMQMTKISHVFLNKDRTWCRDKANLGNTFGIDGMSGGQVDALITLWGLDRSSGIVLLDEPGQNLGSHEREILRDVLCQCKTKQLVVVTHHVEMLDRMNLFRRNDAAADSHEAFISNVIRMDLATTMFRRRQQSAVTCKTFACDEVTCGILRNPELLALWFCRGAILVEGITDRGFMTAISELLTKADFSKLFSQDPFHVLWRIFDCGGHENVRNLATACDLLGIPSLAIIDSDTMLNPEASAKGTQKGTQKAGHIHLLKKRPAWHGDNSLFFGLRAAVWIPSDGIPVGQVLALNEVQKAQGMNLSEIAETDAAALTVDEEGILVKVVQTTVQAVLTGHEKKSAARASEKVQTHISKVIVPQLKDVNDGSLPAHEVISSVLGLALDFVSIVCKATFCLPSVTQKELNEVISKAVSSLQAISGKSKDPKPNFEISIQDKVTGITMTGKIELFANFFRSYAALLLCYHRQLLKTGAVWADLRHAILGKSVQLQSDVDGGDAAAAGGTVDVTRVMNTIDTLSCILRSPHGHSSARTLLWPTDICDIEGLIISKAYAKRNRKKIEDSDDAGLMHWLSHIQYVQKSIGEEADDGTLTAETLEKKSLKGLFWEIDTLQKIIWLRAAEDATASSCKRGLQILVDTLSRLFNPTHKSGE